MSAGLRYRRGMDRGEDRDDWFSGVEPEEREAPAGAEADHPVEDWLRPSEPPPRPRRAAIDRRVPILAVLAIVLVLAVLAAAGVFSGSSRPPVPAVTSTPTVATQTTQTTTTTTQALPAPSVSLKPGDTGAQVKVLQRALRSLGFSTGKIDGTYGPKTEAAVKRFQRSVRLTADGIVGPKTLAALAAALRRS